MSVQDLAPEQHDKLLRFAAMLAEEGVRIGAVSEGDAARAWERHVEDSLLAVELLPRGPVSCVDVGSGAGLPGVVVAVARPEARMTLVESRRRRCDFLARVCNELDLRCEVICSRVELLGRGPGREVYDIAVSRALAGVAVTIEYSLPLLRVGGRMVGLRAAPTGEEREAAAKVASLLGGGEPRWVRLGERRSGQSEAGPRGGPPAPGRRSLETWGLVVPKVSESPPEYPRRPGIPSKRPLP